VTALQPHHQTRRRRIPVEMELASAPPPINWNRKTPINSATTAYTGTLPVQSRARYVSKSLKAALAAQPLLSGFFFDPPSSGFAGYCFLFTELVPPPLSRFVLLARCIGWLDGSIRSALSQRNARKHSLFVEAATKRSYGIMA